jgi:putative aldouronate transport system permease protein
MNQRTELPHKPRLVGRVLKQWRLQVMVLPLTLWCIAIFYVPYFGNIIAFQDYRIHRGFLGSPFVGFKHFRAFFSDWNFTLLLRNTMVLGLLQLFFGTIAAVLFAVLLNELRSFLFKRAVQTISYLPYFVSWAVVANLFISMLADPGPVNDLLVRMNLIDEPMLFLSKPELHWTIVTVQNIWKNMGWNAIIYLAAITSIPPDLFEAAYVDGADRFRRIWHITLPSIVPTIAVLLIMNSGQLMQAQFEQQFLMFNSSVMEVAEIIPTYVYKRGLAGGQYSFATAVGTFQSVVSVSILLVVNRFCRKVAGISLW